jgi:GH35 family endo-1,4-beta-xylanase
MNENKIPQNRAEFRERLGLLTEAAESRIAAGIESNRKSDAIIRVVDAAGGPVSGVEIGVEQVSSSFRFGANAFMLGGFETPEMNQRWEQRFSEAFNQAVVPFFWKDTEPVRGQPRFDANSPKAFRRPPTDAVLAFCKRHGIEPKAHCLTYHQFTPDWMPDDPVACREAYAAYFAQVGKRYHAQIPVWDVVNEAMSRWAGRHRAKSVPPDWVRWSFRAAREHFPGCQLVLNEANSTWEEDGYHHFGFETHPFVLLAQNLLLQGIPVDALGLQYHLFDYKEEDLWKRSGEDIYGSHMLHLERLLATLDHYQTLGLPLHISEITLPCYGETEDDESLQAELARMLYRAWFSHPAVRSITYWNVVDGYAHGKEGELRGALVRKDLSEKTIYREVKKLIREEWRTRIASRVYHDGTMRLRGFHGSYRVTLRKDGKEMASAFHVNHGKETEALIKWP